MSFLQSINLFPETRYFRVRRIPELNHQCGGVASLCILGALLAILGLKLREAFNMQTVFVTSQNYVEAEPRLTNISTNQNNPTQAPYMMAISYPRHGCSSSVITARAELVEYLNNSLPSMYIVKTPIPMEKCTAEHLVNMPIHKSTLGTKNWDCLPLNRTFELGGNLDFSLIHRRIEIHVSCTNSCPLSFCGSAVVHQLASKINAHNLNAPFQYYLQKDYLDVGYNIFNQYRFQLTQNLLTTDKSLTPRQQIVTENGFSIEPMGNLASIWHDYHSYTNIRIERSEQTNTVERKYLKLVDVLSYVGGIFPALFGIFFFMKAFGMYFFEMTFAFSHFKCKQTKYSHFGQFLKQMIYKGLKGLPFIRNWKIAQRQYEINNLVNKMLDINYLYKRIEFLQSAISVLLNDHQLKGVYLSQVTLNKADSCYHDHRIRDRVITYLQKQAKEKEKKQKRLNRSKHKRRKKGDQQQIMDERIVKDESKKKKDSYAEYVKQRMMSPEHRSYFMIKAQQQKKEKQKERQKLKIKEKQEMLKELELSKAPKVSQRIKHQSLARIHSQKIINEGQNNIIKIQEPKPGLKENEKGILPQHKRYLLARQYAMLEPVDELELDQLKLKQQIRNDLRRLFEEAKKETGDPVSRRIVENIDQWLRIQLEETIQKVQEEESPPEIILIKNIDE